MKRLAICSCLQPEWSGPRRCRTGNDVQTRLTGYRVNYEYRGQEFTTVMRDNPGGHLQVRVSVDPIEQ